MTAWYGVPVCKAKGPPDRTTRNMHGEGREGREERETAPWTQRPAASAAPTRPGRCARQGSSSTQCYAPAARLGSLRASPWGSHWRQASSSGPAAPAARATTHQGDGGLGKCLQPRLLSIALTRLWQNSEAGEGQGSEPREPGGLSHQARGVA